MREGAPHVTITRSAWRSIATQAAGHAREAGGLIIGKQTRMGTYIIENDVALAHIESTKSQVRYDRDEIDRARAAAYSTYGPALEPLGGWHTHPWPVLSMEAILPQLSDVDVEMMSIRDLELIVVTFPVTPVKRVPSEFAVSRKVGSVHCRGEIYLKVNDVEAVPCTMSLR